jgi:hypothetical protein
MLLDDRLSRKKSTIYASLFVEMIDREFKIERVWSGRFKDGAGKTRTR